MLKENPQKRPNIYEVVKEVCDMQKKEVPIRDVRSPLCDPNNWTKFPDH
jgi:AP2-associated kinase